ncbi:MAG: acylneuraminate cytidylyltransferase family protein [Firmicutes bacterium]|nr:acylneuraminate cytidylyltransferase family protein [Bacillota bacterium]
MYKDLSVLGFIPARAGSQGIPGKNVIPLAGRPLLIHTLDAAKKSEVFDHLIVSTDGDEIARIAIQEGADVPFKRPPELSTGDAKGIDVLHHTMRWLEDRGRKHNCVMVLQPTSPLRTAQDITGALDLFIKRNADAVVSVCETEHHPWWSNTLPEDGCMAGFIRADVSTNRQNLPKFYRLNGAIYLAQWDFIYRSKTWFGPRTYAYVMPRYRSVDIDDPIDLALAEVLIARQL